MTNSSKKTEMLDPYESESCVVDDLIETVKTSLLLSVSSLTLRWSAIVIFPQLTKTCWLICSQLQNKLYVTVDIYTKSSDKCKGRTLIWCGLDS